MENRFHIVSFFWIQIQINHLLCKWIPVRLQALDKETSFVIISVGPKPH